MDAAQWHPVMLQTVVAQAAAQYCDAAGLVLDKV